MDMAYSQSRSEQPEKSIRGFWALVATQFQGAFNDNLFKTIIVLFLIQEAMRWGKGAGESGTAAIAGFATVLFSLPFVLFPGFAGALADRFSKRHVSIMTKYWEVGVMALSFVAFILGSTAMVWALLFLMAMQSTFFSPAKYGLLPEILSEKRLSWGNGIIQMTTFVAIIAGTAVAGPIREWLGAEMQWASLMLVVLSLLGLICSHGITKIPSANPRQTISWNPWSGTWRNLKVLRADRWLLLTVLGIVYFWFAGVVVLQNMVTFGKSTMQWSDAQVSTLQALLAFGIGLGSLAAGYLSRGRIEVGLIPLGAFGMAFFSGALGLLTSRLPRLLILGAGLEDAAGLYALGFPAVLALTIGLGFCAGLYEVPLWAVLQSRSPAAVKGGVIATTNLLTFAGMLVAGGLYYVILRPVTVGPFSIDLHTYHVFWLTAVATLVVTGAICYLLPVATLRLGLWFLVNTLYRLRVRGVEHVPSTGGALLVANHVSFIDALVVTGSLDRPVRFLMSHELYENRWLRPIARLSHAIPVSPADGPREILKALHAATQAIREGELVCIFAEGQVSRTGQMLPFHKGLERVMKHVDAPVIPIYLDQLWGSIFSFEGGKFFWKVPHRIPYPITVSFGPPLSPDSSAVLVRRRIQELGTEAYMHRPYPEAMLHRAFVRKARHCPFSLAMADLVVPRITYFKTLVGHSNSRNCSTSSR